MSGEPQRRAEEAEELAREADAGRQRPISITIAWMSGPFAYGDRVRKKSGSEWEGRIVGCYSTRLTPIGYAVESDVHRGSVQIYPAAALEVSGTVAF